MKRQARRVQTDLAVIGTGIAGFAAALFARDRGLEVSQFGHTGAIAYTTGYLDLLGVLDGTLLSDPWAGLDALRTAEPDHPLTRLPNATIRTAMRRFIAALNEMGVGYTEPGRANLNALLPYGLTKPTLSIPRTMLPGIEALERGAETVMADFEGLQGFSGREFQVNLAARWPALRSARVAFPGMEGRQVFAEVMARAMETARTRAALAERLRPLIGSAKYVALPAILGIHAPDKVHAEMERLLGARLFEVPTIPPAVPGIRLREMFESGLPKRGVALEPLLKVASVTLDKGAVRLTIHGPMEDLTVEARAAILATGRFLSGGLASDRNTVSETLIGLPVAASSDRDTWFRQDYLDPRGHPLNRLGIATDTAFRPLSADGTIVNPRLFAAGAILAGQDWVRQRCGVSLAVASAWGAVGAAAQLGTA